MSIIGPAASAYYTAERAATDNSVSQPVSQPSKASAPQRETELSRQLEDRLTNEVSRIRRQIAPDAATAAFPQDGRGSRLDIRA